MRTHDEFTQDLDNHGDLTTQTSSSFAYTEADARQTKTRRFIHPAQRICYDWMVVSGNCHYARDAAAFTTYRPVRATLSQNIFNPLDETQVAGVGTVHLRVRRRPTDQSNNNKDITTEETGVIVLEDVLHIPEAVCNGFNPLLVGSSMSCHHDHWEGASRTGQPMWYSLPFAGGTRLVLAEEPVGGESELIEGRYYTLSLYISPEERKTIAESLG